VVRIRPDVALSAPQSTDDGSEGLYNVRGVTKCLYRVIGVAIAIALMEALARLADEPLARVPFVTSIVLTLGKPDSKAAKPYAVIVGHLLSAFAGFTTLWWLGPGTTAAAVGVGLATLLMLWARALHPPAGIDGFLVSLLGLPLDWALKPVFVGALMLALFASLWSRGEGLLLRCPADPGRAPRGCRWVRRQRQDG
jgi:CBS-domain-containing membrane protein